MIGFFEDTVADNVKIRYAWTPEPWDGVGYLLTLAVGAMFSWAVVYVTVLLAVVAIFGSFDRDPTMLTYGFAAMIGVVGAIGFVWGLSPFRYRRATRHQPFRRTRLDHLAMQDDVWRRLPHRMVEKALFMRTDARQQMKWLLRKLKPGDTVLLNWPRGAGHQRPKANKVPFEPIDIDVDDERLTWLSVLNRQEQGDGGIDEVPEQGEDDKGAPSLNRQVLGLALWVVLMLLGFLYWIRGFVIGRSLTSFIIIVFTLGFFLLWWLLPLFAERKWWLVPGGMICREFRFWRKGHRVELITPAETPLVVDMRSGMGYLLQWPSHSLVFMPPVDGEGRRGRVGEPGSHADDGRSPGVSDAICVIPHQCTQSSLDQRERNNPTNSRKLQPCSLPTIICSPCDPAGVKDRSHGRSETEPVESVSP